MLVHFDSIFFYKFSLRILFKCVPLLAKEKNKTDIFVPIGTLKHIRKDTIFVLATIQGEIFFFFLHYTNHTAPYKLQNKHWFVSIRNISYWLDFFLKSSLALKI